jgi:CDP-glucose 4,6-dehydratase
VILYNFFKNKKVLVTGHTGFKGSWLVAWLNILGCEVMGISLNPVKGDNHFKILKKNLDIIDKRGDIRNEKYLKKLVKKFKPDIVFHLAAQAIVSTSYSHPKLTFETNVLGTLNLLNALAELKNKCIGIFVTSDKCYKNIEVTRGYTETDELGGDDFYSSSKASAELAIHSFYKSFIKDKNKFLRIGTARAGNVVGGGDWSKNRLIPDCVKSWSKNKIVTLRNPNSTRPWQHVLEALSGYLHLAYQLDKNQKLNGESFNFSNNEIKNFTVLKFINGIQKYWKNANWKVYKKSSFYESTLLQLNSNKAKKLLNWKNKLKLSETIKLVGEWYTSYYESNKKKILTKEQIIFYMRKK